MSDRLSLLVERVRDYQMTPVEVAEQRVSFAYGNASKENNSSKDEVRNAVQSASAPNR
ncbi:hypothetical protein [Salipiger aestuarii]|uniref:hypothetical protein n=1 Tax=Salipiger aestuarii TaxID=568098 RepID=UPI001681B562|nr:hypothetical protein [Salipiger aestuarii]